MTDTVVNASVSAALSSPQFRTRDEKISRLATLPDNDYIILINLNIAAFAACAKEVGFPFFNHLLSDYESNRFRADATKNLLDIASDSVEKHANQIVEAISGQGKAEILFTFRNARSGILKDAGDGILVVSYSGRQRNQIPIGQRPVSNTVALLSTRLYDEPPSPRQKKPTHSVKRSYRHTLARHIPLATRILFRAGYLRYA